MLRARVEARVAELVVLTEGSPERPVQLPPPYVMEAQRDLITAYDCDVDPEFFKRVLLKCCETWIDGVRALHPVITPEIEEMMQRAADDYAAQLEQALIPAREGSEIRRRIRQQAASHHTPFSFCTGIPKHEGPGVINTGEGGVETLGHRYELRQGQEQPRDLYDPEVVERHKAIKEDICSQYRATQGATSTPTEGSTSPPNHPLLP
jgi:hypothetical protein